MILKESERVCLRKMTLEDMDAVWAYRLLEQEREKLYCSGDVLEKQELIEYVLNSNLPYYNRFDWSVMAVISKEDGKLIGDCRLSVGEGGASVYCTISPEYRRRGLGREVLMLAIDRVFDLPEVTEMGVAVDSRHVAAIRLMESVGMKFTSNALDRYARGKADHEEVFYELTWQEWRDWKARNRIIFPREEYESPECIRQWRWKYHHMGIPTQEKKRDEIHMEHLGFYVSGFRTSPFGIEWVRFDSCSPAHALIQNIPHIAFEIEDIEAELDRHSFQLIIPPKYLTERVKVAMIEFDQAPIELIQFMY